MLSLSQDLFGLNIGIDNLLFDAKELQSGSAHPGRMSPLTALGFLLCASILLSLNRHKQKPLFTLSHGLILLLGMLALSGIGMDVLMLLFLFAAFYRSVMNTIAALDEVSGQMRRSDIDRLSDIPASDEMGDIVGSFNAIAEALIQTNSQMSTIVDHAVDGIITIDIDGVIHSFNPASQAIFGFHADEVIGLNIEMLMPESYRSRHHAGLASYEKTGKGAIMGQRA